MDKNVVIKTDRLLLRIWNMEDIDDIVEGLNNINVSKWLAGAPYPYTKKDAKDFVKKTIDNDLYNFAIVLKSENKAIGGTQLTDISLANGIAGGGIWINEKYQEKGYGTEAWGARIKYAFEVLGLRRLENGYFKDNISSWKMQEKFGYKNEGISRQMLYGVIIRLKEMGIENAYINSYDWRRKVYNSAGFETEDSIGFWHKKI